MYVTQGSNCLKLDGEISYWMGNVKTGNSWSHYLTGDRVIESIELSKEPKKEERIIFLSDSYEYNLYLFRSPVL